MTNLKSTSRTDKYQKKGEIEHILDRPDMYIGTTRNKKSVEYIAIPKITGGFEIVEKEVSL